MAMSETETIEVSPDRFEDVLNGSGLQDDIRRFLDDLKGLELHVDTDSRSWEFRFAVASSESPPDSLPGYLNDVFRNKVDHLRDVRVSFLPGSGQSLEDWIQLNWENLKQYLSDHTPAGGSMLEYARPELTDAGLVVELADEEIVKISEERNLTEVIAGWIEDRFGESVDVEFAVGDFSDSIEEDAEQFQEETRRELQEQRRRQQVRAEKQNEKMITGQVIKTDPIELRDLPSEEKNSITVQGQIIDHEFVQTSANKQNLIKGVISDRTDSIGYKIFMEGKDEGLMGLEGEWVKLRGQLQRDTYSRARDLVIFARDINRRPPMIREDTADDKRVELHCHTSMSQMDALFDVEELVERAAYWNHEAIAVTDHGVVHSFPDAAHAAEDYGVKIIYGVEGYLVQDDRPVALNVSYVHSERNLSEEYVAVDCATTGPDPHKDEIFHLTAHRVVEGEVEETFDRVIATDAVPGSVLDHTPLTQSEISEGDPREEVLEAFKSFLDDSVLVAFEADSIRHFLEEAGVSLDGPILHLRRLAEELWEPLQSDLDRIVENRFDVTLDHQLDPGVTVQHKIEIFQELQLELPDPLTLEAVQDIQEEINYKGPSNHIILLAVNQQGLENLYRLISHSHVHHFYRNPRMLRSKIDENRVGLMVGSACEAGEIFQAVVHGESEDEIKERMKFYDMIEIQPVENNKFMLNEGGSFQNITSEEDLEEINRKIYRLAQEMDKPVIGTGDVHFTDPEDEVFRRIIQDFQGFDDPDNQPPLYYRTTDEMIEQFRYLGEEAAREVAVENPQAIADRCDRIDPIPDGFHPPKVERAEERFLSRISERLEELYGEDPPGLIKDRIDVERDSIIENEFANLYVMAAELVDKSHEDGYLVGSRGSVGSSFTAYLMDITEVNPLPPHYRCENCKYVEFPEDPDGDIGVDLESRDCPECGTTLDRDGFDIPFEVFLGFEGTKVPDIDLNFSGEYQQEMFDYVEELFGEENVFRAGTIDTVADKTAATCVNEYMKDRQLTKREAEKTRLRKGLTGVKQNTSQHPGGMIIVPEDRSIYEFTPINLPANDQDARFQTTHFDYHAMEEQLVKLDVLGHDDPTQLRHLQDLTGVDPVDIPLDDEKTMELFSDISVLGIEADELGMETGVLAVPEFNTTFVRGMVEETRPDTFADLIRISGLSHGEQVWLDNAQELIKSDTADLSSVISARDDIMNRLIDEGVPEEISFRIMEDVRKGRGLDEDQIKKMKAQNVPDWYVESCKRISYLFPKAHAVAYVVMAFRIAYFKVHYPTEFYASFFSLKTSSIDARYVTSQEQVEARMQDLEEIMNRNEDKGRDRQEYKLLEVMKEAYLRGVSVKPPRLEKSRPRQFVKEGESTIRAPYVTVESMGGTVADSIKTALDKREFSSIEDVKNRTGLNKAVEENAKEVGFFEDLPDEENHDLFE